MASDGWDTGCRRCEVDTGDGLPWRHRREADHFAVRIWNDAALQLNAERAGPDLDLFVHTVGAVGVAFFADDLIIRVEGAGLGEEARLTKLLEIVVWQITINEWVWHNKKEGEGLLSGAYMAASAKAGLAGAGGDHEDGGFPACGEIR